MWYTGDIIPLDETEKSAIGLATSSDGLHWRKFSGNPVLVPEPSRFDDLAVYDPAVILDKDIFRMWDICVNDELFSGPRPLGWHICYAWSRDGKTWTKFDRNPVLHHGNFPFEKNELGSPTVLREGNTYKMWYVGGVFHDLALRPVPFQAAGIGYATWEVRKGSLEAPLASLRRP